MLIGIILGLMLLSAVVGNMVPSFTVPAARMITGKRSRVERIERRISKTMEWEFEDMDIKYIDDCVRTGQDLDVAYLVIPDQKKHIKYSGQAVLEEVFQNEVNLGTLSSAEKSELLELVFDMVAKRAEEHIFTSHGLEQTMEASREKYRKRLGKPHHETLFAGAGKSRAGIEWDREHDAIEAAAYQD